MEIPKTLQEAIQHFADPENCRRFMVEVRWLDGEPKCPYCGCEKVTWLAKAKVYRCYGDHPRQKFSLKIGTVFEDSPIGLEKWLPAVWLLCNSKNGISSYELHRALGVTQKTAWFMLHRIRLAMQTGSFFRKMGGGNGGGPVEVDEAYIGGNPANRHRHTRNARESRFAIREFGPKEPRKWITGRATEKTPVVGLLDRETRQVRAQVVPKVKREVLMDAILENVEKGSKVFTDGLRDYMGLPALEFVHETVTHLDEYVRGEVHTQGIENFWSLLKRGLKGTYVAVEPVHLGRYVDEQVFRYNNRATKENPLNDADRFMLAVSQIAGKRLTYAELTGKVPETPF